MDAHTILLGGLEIGISEAKCASVPLMTKYLIREQKRIPYNMPLRAQALNRNASTVN